MNDSMALVSSTVTPASPVCDHSINDRNFRLYSLIPACTIILILAFLNKRRDCLPGVCSGRPGPILPINLLDGFKNRWTFAVAFGATTAQIFTLFNQSTSNTQDLVETVEPVLYVFAFMLSLLVVTIDFYPFFACLSTQHTIIGAALGFLYSTAWCVVTAIYVFECPNNNPQALPYFDVFQYLPVLLCLFFLACRYMSMLIQAWRNKSYISEDQNQVAYPHHMKHVRTLFTRPQFSEETFFQRHVYKRRDDFQFTTRMLSTIIVSVMLLYMMETLFITSGSVVVFQLKKVCSTLNGTDTLNRLRSVCEETTETIVQGAWFFSVPITLIVTIGNLLHTFKCHRKNLLRMYIGDKSFLPAIRKARDEMGYAMKYSGYQVAHFVWGIIILHLCVLVGSVIIIAIIWLITKDPSYFGNIIVAMMPVIIVLLLMWCPSILSRFFFLQEKVNDYDADQPLAVRNRYAYHNVNYYAFYWLMFMGLVSCLMRIGKSMVLGVIMLSRLDRPLLMKGWEHYDTSYMSYVGLLHTEHAHNHPVLRVFCQLLIDRNRDENREMHAFIKSRAVMRWHVAYTHIRNGNLKMLAPSEFKAENESQSTLNAEGRLLNIQKHDYERLQSPQSVEAQYGSIA